MRVRTTSLLFALAFAAGCDAKDPTDGFVMRFKFAPAKTVAIVGVMDAATNQPITETVTIRFSGSSVNRVVDGTGERFTEGTTSNGFIGFGLTGAAPTAASPLPMIVDVSAPGYAGTTEQIALNDTLNAYQIKLVKLSAPPVGSSAIQAQAGTAGTSGALQQAVTVTTPPEPTTGGVVSLQLAAGTTLRDGSGAPLTGALTATAVYFNGLNEASRTALPNGGNHNPDPGAATDMVPAVATSISIRDAAGREAKTVTGGEALLTLDLPRDALNVATGARYAAGNTLRISSYDPARDAFSRDAVATLVAPQANGNFRITTPITHFSYYFGGEEIPYCDGGRSKPIHVKLEPHQGTPNLKVYFKIGGEYVSSQDVVANTQFMPFSNTDYPGKIDAFNSEGTPLGSLVYSNLCNDLTFNLTYPPPTTVTFDVTVTCEDDMEIRPTSFVFVSQVGGSDSFMGFLVNGVGEFKDLKPNTTYSFTGAVYTGGRWRVGTAPATTGATGTTTPVALRYDLGDRC